ncbi:Increased DNA methylation 3 [Camellia lanceoleosa]|uniref:Increased DNA methylation 3 n=1 Tax=Camellia lanceoleosa TaxID=1840588 RepID=A0ACC0HSS1_9ERIC|nr:Increased DNA methylation 3 [Camellia lanceoleosa]
MLIDMIDREREGEIERTEEEEESPPPSLQIQVLRTKFGNINMDPAVVLTGTANERRVGHGFGSVEIGRSESAYIFRVALPGVRRNGCNVKYTIQPNGKVHVEGLVGNVAMLKDMPNPFEMKVEQLCPSGPFHVTFDLPGPVDPRLCSPNFRPDGILEVVVKAKKP